MNQENFDTCNPYKADNRRSESTKGMIVFSRSGENFTLLGRSSAFAQMIALIDKVAKVQAPVLIEGETGTGKEMVARAVHYRGSRRDHAFVPINCGAFPDGLIESELFGHVRGAFTDAKTDQPGLVEAAAGGTLFLDEVDALTPRAQVTLLRFLQDGSYRPIGGRVERRANVRVIAATNGCLDDLISSRAFRSDLLYRLRVLGLKLPPLRERGDDALLLAKAFFERYKAQFNCAVEELDQDSCNWFRRYSWPGNVRELEGLVYRGTVICEEATLRLAPPAAFTQERRCTPERRTTASFDERYSSAKSKTLQQFERQNLTQLMVRANGNVSQAARMAGKERRALGKLLKKHSITIRDCVNSDPS
jgi:DNA-binding NtrC family response regulator